MFFGDVFKALNKAQVKYVVAGGVAVNIYGYQRLTKDLDLMVFWEEKNLGKMYNALEKIGYLSKVPVSRRDFLNKRQRKKWEEEKGMVVFSFVHRNPPFNIVDVFINEPIPFKKVYENKSIITIDRIKIPLISIDHLIKLKLKAGRGRDLDDIVQMREIKKRMLEEGAS